MNPRHIHAAMPRVATGLRPSLLLLVAVLVAALSAAGAARAEPPVRSTRYDGASSYSYPDHAAFRPSGSLTVEAWVLREDALRCETIASKGYQTSWWLGFCSRPRFYTSGGAFFDADRPVPQGRWCHVAVTVNDNGVARFYLDGSPAGSAALPAVSQTASPVRIGADIGGGFQFLGRIDELRIWDIALTEEQIRIGMHHEWRQTPGLLAALGDGGPREAMNALTGTASGAPASDNLGMLPRELRVPHTDVPPSFDGAFAPAEYAGAERAVLRYHDAGAVRDATAHLVHDGTHLYVGVEGVRAPVQPGVGTVLALLFDPDLVPNGHPTPDELGVVVLADPQVPAYGVRGDGVSTYLACDDTGDCPPAERFDARRGFACESQDTAPCVEFRIATELFGNDPSRVGLMLYHAGYQDPKDGPNVASVPGDASLVDPTTWTVVELEPAPAPVGSGSCEDPFRLPSNAPVVRFDDLSSFTASAVDSSSCVPLPVPGPDVVYAYNPPVSGRYRVALRPVADQNGPADANVAILIGLSCGPNGLECVAGSDESGAGLPEVAELELEAQRDYRIVVDGSDGPEGESLRSIELRIDRVVDDRLVLTHLDVPSAGDLKDAGSELDEVWEEDPAALRVVGAIDESRAPALGLKGWGVSTFPPPLSHRPQPVEPPIVRFDRFRYDVGPDTATLMLEIPGVTPANAQTVWVVSETTHDVESVTLSPNGPVWTGSIPIARPDGDSDELDGVVHAKLGEILIGLYPNPNDLAAKPAVGIAMVKGRTPTGRVSLTFDPSLAPPTDATPGRHPGEPARPLGVLADHNGVAVTLGLDQILIGLSRFRLDMLGQGVGGFRAETLQEAGAYVVGDRVAAGGTKLPFELLRFDPDGVDIADAEFLLELLGAEGTFRVSNETVFALLVLCAELRLQGFSASPNFIAQAYGQPAPDDPVNVFRDGFGTDCLQSAHRAWMYTSLADRDTRRVRVAVIDSNFCEELADEATVLGGYDFYNFSSSPWGLAETFGTGGAFHGTKMASIAAGRFGNGIGAAGSGGQVAELLLFNVGGMQYFFDAALATVAATGSGAEVINMSFGFPCGIAGLNLCDLALGPFTCLFLGPIIDFALQAAQPFIPFPVPPPGVACPLVVSIAGSMNTALTAAIAGANAAGTTVVASAGNPNGDIGPTPIELFHIIPAMIPGVITVGVTDDAYQNTMMYGSRIDVWVRELTSSFAPPEAGACAPFTTQTTGGTSSGAAYVSGVVAMIRAVNPGLSPAGIRSVLRANTTRAPGGDPRVLRFLRTGDAVIRAGTAPTGSLPSLRFVGPSLALDEDDGTLPGAWAGGACGPVSTRPLVGDDATTAIPIPYAVAASASGWHIEDAGLHAFTASGDLESDWYALQPPEDAGACDAYRIEVRLTYPSALGDLVLELPSGFNGSSVDVGFLRQRTWVGRSVFLSSPLAFRVTGEDNVYEMTVLVRPDTTLPLDRYEPNDSSTAPAVIDVSAFHTTRDRRFVEHVLTLEDLTHHCPGDFDVFRIDLPETLEDCLDTASPCGSEEAVRRLTQLHVAAPGGGSIQVRRLDRTVVATGDGSVRVSCPRAQGLGSLLVLVRPSTAGGSNSYDLSVRYRAPVRLPTLADLGVEVAGFICCDASPDCVTTRPLAPGLVSVDLWSAFETLPHPSEFDVACPESECEVPPSQYLRVDWPGVEEPFAVGIRFERAPPASFTAVLLDPDHVRIAEAQPADASRTEWTLDAKALPAGPYYVRVRGLPPREPYTIYNLDPLPFFLDDARLRLVGGATNGCGTEGSLFVEVQADEPFAGVSLGLEWNATQLELLDTVVGPDVPPADVFALVHNDSEAHLGRVVVALTLEAGRTLDTRTPKRVIELRYRALAGASTSTPAEVCVVEGILSPPVEVIVTVRRGTSFVSVYPPLECGALSIAPDADPPEITCPADLFVAGTADGAVVSYSVNATDTCGDVELVCTPPSGSVFPVGTTTVVCSAVDGAGNQSTCRFDVNVLSVGRFRRGDSNGDGSVNIADPSFTLAFLFRSGRKPLCFDAADATDDGEVNITDPIRVLNFLFLGAPPPTSPGPFQCGEDDKEDNLEPCEYDACAGGQ